MRGSEPGFTGALLCKPCCVGSFLVITRQDDKSGNSMNGFFLLVRMTAV